MAEVKHLPINHQPEPKLSAWAHLLLRVRLGLSKKGLLLSGGLRIEKENLPKASG